MIRIFVAIAAFALSSCAGPDKVVLPPLPIDGQIVTWPDVLIRLRTQATRANEAFYIDNWETLVQTSKDLEQTAAFLPKAGDIPEARKATLVGMSASLIDDSRKLSEAASAKDKNILLMNETLQRIHLAIRNLAAK